MIFKQAWEDFLKLNLLGNKSMPAIKQPKSVAKRTTFVELVTEKNKSNCHLSTFAKILEDTIKAKRYSQIPKLIEFWHKNLQKADIGAEGYTKDEQINLLQKLKKDAASFQLSIRRLRDEKEIAKVKEGLGKENFETGGVNGTEYVQRITAAIFGRIQDLR